MDMDIINHLQIFLLSHLLNLGDQLSGQAFGDQLRRQLRSQDDEHAAVCSHSKTLFGRHSDLDQIPRDFGILTAQI